MPTFNAAVAAWATWDGTPETRPEGWERCYRDRKIEYPDGRIDG